MRIKKVIVVLVVFVQVKMKFAKLCQPHQLKRSLKGCRSIGKNGRQNIRGVRVVPGDVFKARCTLCKKAVSVAYAGKGDLLNHSGRRCHRRAQTSANKCAIDGFLRRNLEQLQESTGR